MEELHGDAVAVHQHPEGAAPHLLKGRVGQRAAFLLLNGGRLRDLLQIVPEYAPPQPHGDGGEAPHRHVQRTAQNGNVHRLCQRGGQAEEVVPVAALGGGVDLGGIVQPHPPEALGGGEVFGEEVVDGLKILGHVLLQTVQHIGVPALRRNVQLAAAAALQQLFVEQPGVVQHDLIAAGEQQGRRQTRQVAEQRRAQRVGGLVGVALGVELQQRLGHGGVDILVGLVGRAGAGEICPRRDADEAAGQLHAQLLQLQAQGVDQSAAGALTAQQDLLGGVALFQQVAVGLQRILQRGGEAVLRRQTVGGAEHLDAALRRQRGGKALGILQTAAGVAAAVEVQNDAGAPLVLGHDPRTLKARKGVLLHQHLPLVEGGHQLAQLVLPLAGHLQRAVGHKGLEEIQL